jgi:colanic acid/amylovoran biosynthesis glycosyltransferase
MGAPRPVVAHVLREALPATQTFVVNQVMHLQRYRPVVVSERRGPLALDGVESWCALEHTPARRRWAETAVDRAVRASLPRTQRERRRYVTSAAAQVIHYHFLVNARSYLGLSRSSGVPAVVSAYGYDVSLFPRRLGGLGRRLLGPVFSELELVLAMSEDMRDDLCTIGCPEDRIVLHYHGIDTARFAVPDRSYDDAGPVRIICVGRLTRVKGQDKLIEALALLRRRGVDNFEVTIVGDGPLGPALRQQIDQHGMSGVVTMTGHVDHGNGALPGLYRDADLFALPATTVEGRKEGIPGTLVEAMAAGLPIVSTRHAGIPSVVADGEEGVLVDEDRLRSGDADELVRALELLLTDAGARRRLGTRAAARAGAELDVVPATARLEQIYDRVRGCARSKGPARAVDAGA